MAKIFVFLSSLVCLNTYALQSNGHRSCFINFDPSAPLSEQFNQTRELQDNFEKFGGFSFWSEWLAKLISKLGIHTSFDETKMMATSDSFSLLRRGSYRNGKKEGIFQSRRKTKNGEGNHFSVAEFETTIDYYLKDQLAFRLYESETMTQSALYTSNNKDRPEAVLTIFNVPENISLSSAPMTFSLKAETTKMHKSGAVETLLYKDLKKPIIQQMRKTSPENNKIEKTIVFLTPEISTIATYKSFDPRLLFFLERSVGDTFKIRQEVMFKLTYRQIERDEGPSRKQYSIQIQPLVVPMPVRHQIDWGQREIVVTEYMPEEDRKSVHRFRLFSRPHSHKVEVEHLKSIYFQGELLEDRKVRHFIISDKNYWENEITSGYGWIPFDGRDLFAEGY